MEHIEFIGAGMIGLASRLEELIDTGSVPAGDRDGHRLQQDMTALPGRCVDAGSGERFAGETLDRARTARVAGEATP
jgi:hypothetical protein